MKKVIGISLTTCLFFQLAMIQTEWVVGKLKEIHPEIHFEIGQDFFSSIYEQEWMT